MEMPFRGTFPHHQHRLMSVSERQRSHPTDCDWPAAVWRTGRWLWRIRRDAAPRLRIHLAECFAGAGVGQPGPSTRSRQRRASREVTSATRVPSLSHCRNLNPPPGAMITPAPVAVPGSGRNTVMVGSTTFRTPRAPVLPNTASCCVQPSEPGAPPGQSRTTWWPSSVLALWSGAGTADCCWGVLRCAGADTECQRQCCSSGKSTHQASHLASPRIRY